MYAGVEREININLNFKMGNIFGVEWIEIMGYASRHFYHHILLISLSQILLS